MVKLDWNIGLTRRKIKEKIREYKGDIWNGIEKTDIVKITLNENININYDKTRKVTNYNNRNYAYFRELTEILSNKKACNNEDHFTLHEEW